MTLPSLHVARRAGSAVLASLAGRSQRSRDRALVDEVLGGNVPDFLRAPVPVPMTTPTVRNAVRAVCVVPQAATAAAVPSRPPTNASVSVLCDYLSVGTDDDYVYVRLQPDLAQVIATACGCLLPTTAVVDAVAVHAQVVPFQSLTLARVRAQGGGRSLAPGEDRGSTRWWQAHEALLRQARVAARVPSGALVAGHMKDIVISASLWSHVVFDRDDSLRSASLGPSDLPHVATNVRVDEGWLHLPVAIFGGWGSRTSCNVQPPSTVHASFYADYSHGVRLVAQTAHIDGRPVDLADALRDPARAPIFNSGPPGLRPVIDNPRYPTGPRDITRVRATRVRFVDERGHAQTRYIRRGQPVAV